MDSTSSLCDKSHMLFHIGAQWLSEMAVAHYLSFRAVQSISSLPWLGLSYEADVLYSPQRAFRRILRFLQLSGTGIPHPQHKKGLQCRLSNMLVNYEELRCSLTLWQQQSTSSGSLLWMASDEEDVSVTFESAMQSWEELWKSIGDTGHITECSDEVTLKYANRETSREGRGICGVGGETSLCHRVPTDRYAFCALSLQRSMCDAMTYKDGQCYFHKHVNDFRVETCSNGNYISKQ